MHPRWWPRYVPRIDLRAVPAEPFYECTDAGRIWIGKETVRAAASERRGALRIPRGRTGRARSHAAAGEGTAHRHKQQSTFQQKVKSGIKFEKTRLVIGETGFSSFLLLNTLLEIYISYLGRRLAFEKQVYALNMVVGYARVSTGDQKLDLQLDALRQAGCDRVFTDQISGSKRERPGLQEALDYARAGDTLVVWRLDRFGRSLKDLVAKVEALREREVGFRSPDEGSRVIGEEIYEAVGVSSATLYRYIAPDGTARKR